MKKKSLLYLLFLLITTQSAFAQIGYGLEAGYVSNSIASSDLDSKYKAGFAVGLVLDYTLSNNVLLETGLSYQKKGSKLYKLDKPIFGMTELDATMNYLEMPLWIGYKIKNDSKWVITPKLGAFLAIGLDGKGTLHGGDFQTSAGWSNVFDDNIVSIENHNYSYRSFNRFDMGIRLGVNIAYSKYYLTTSYDWGLLETHSTFGKKMENRTWLLALGYKFK